jgi:hypothetical protein
MVAWNPYLANLIDDAYSCFLMLVTGLIVFKIITSQPSFPRNWKEWIIAGILMAMIALFNAFTIAP